MDNSLDAWGVLRNLTWLDLVAIASIVVVARLLSHVVRRAVRHSAEQAPAARRLGILRVSPVLRIVIDVAAVALLIPILIEPTRANVLTVLAASGLILAYALKDYGSSLVAGLVAVLENAYQPGDWVEIDGTYGEVKAIGLRALYLVTPDDTEVIIPHSRLWTANVFNASSGNRSLLAVAEFHLHPDHDAAAVRTTLTGVAESSPHREPGSKVVVVVFDKPWGPLYKVKLVAHESREQFLLITDVTVRGKEALRAAGVRFAQTGIAVPAK